MPSEPTAPTKSGIAVSATGERHIPSSLRADGSVRKEIRVRPGYRPPEDVEVYKNRTAQAWKNRGKGGVPGAEGLKDGGDTAQAPAGGSGAANKNAKRREARKKAATGGAGPDGEGKAGEERKGEAEAVVDPEAEKEKEAKKLTKRLRQARELKDKKEKGDALLPEQFEKVIKISELMRQLDSLGFDANGDKKAAGKKAAGEKEAT